ncbi:MAG: efflux RND transporter periplasmic adaptor subunit [Rhizomicrobium sp.]
MNTPSLPAIDASLPAAVHGRWLQLVGAVRGHYVIALAVLAALILAGVGAWWVMGSGGTATYVTAPLARGAVTRAVTATGSVNPVLTITVGSYVSGVIQEIDCDFNTKVKKGQLCAKIDARPYQTIVEQNQASVATARAQLLKDQANLAYTQVAEKRYAGLIAQKATSQDSYDIAVNALNQARAQVAVDQATIGQHEAELDAATVNLGYTNIVAPVDGIVVSRNVTMGQTVAASFQTPTLFLIATDLSKMEVDTNVSESDVGDVHVGDKGRFTVEAYPDTTFEGVVTQVRQAPQTVQNVITYDVVVTVPNPKLLLMPGMTATMRVITAERQNVLRVPDTALRYVPGGLSAANAQAEAAGPGLWVMRDGRPTRVAVTTGLDDDTNTEIVAGDLKVGDSVIVSERAGTGRKSTSGGPAMRLP